MSSIKKIDTVALRNKLIQFISYADENYLRKIESVISSEDYEVPDDHKEILDKRIAEFEANPNVGVSLEQFKTEFDLKYGA